VDIDDSTGAGLATLLATGDPKPAPLANKLDATKVLTARKNTVHENIVMIHA
jgi:hypothetical protein